MADAESGISLTLFTRQTCTSCDYLVLALELMRPRYEFEYIKVDVDADHELADRYGLRVPVLVDRDHEICSGYCEPAVVEAYLSSQASDHQERISSNR